jgi:acetyl esterase/lipase
MPALHAVLAQPYGQHPRQQLDVFIPERLAARGLVALIHGGWWSQGRHHDLRLLALHLAELGFASATIGHRQLGEGARHGQDLIDDVKAGVVKALDESAIAGGSDSTVVLLGSGSGSLTALTAAAQFSGDARVRVRGAIACGVTPTLEHWEGCTSTVTKALDQFAGSQRHLLSPMDLPAASLPPLLLLHGDSDADVPAKLAQRLHAHAIEADEASSLAVLTGVGHRFIEQPLERGAKAALERIVPFLTEHAREPERERLFTGMADR